MKKSLAGASDSTADTEKAKRVYRAALDTIRRLDDVMKQKKAYRDVFLPEAIILRNRLCDYCERLMFYDPLEFGRKAEELLWRKVYYDIIQLMKHNRKQMKPSSSLESAYRTHLVSAMGYYHHLIFRLQHEHSLQMDVIVDFYLVPEPRSHKKTSNIKKTDTDPRVLDWAYKACHRALLYLGDIARYQQDFEEMGSRILSQRYYYQALALFPDMGMPHNQLGTLAGSSCYNLDAAYHYLRCLTCQNTFDGAQGNLARLLEKNRRRHQELQVTGTQEQSSHRHGASRRIKDVKRLVVRFLHLLDVFYGCNNKVESGELQESCQAILQDFNLVMFYQPAHVTHPGSGVSDHTSADRPQYLEDEVVFKIIIMCMMAVLNLERAGNKQMTAAIAFSLALFSHVLNHVVIRLQSALYELENPRQALQVESPVEELSVEEIQPDVLSSELGGESADSRLTDLHNTSRANSQEKPGSMDIKAERRKNKMSKIRRRRRRTKEGDEPGGRESSGDDSDLSEGGGEGELEVVDSDSGDEATNYLQDGSPPSSDSDSEDNLMVSQELRPGFSDDTARDGLTPASLEDSLDQLQKSCLYNLDTDISSSLANGLNANSEDVSNDVSEYLAGLPTDFISNNNYFNQARLASLFPTAYHDDPSNNADLKAVIHGKKEVSVPPGFETSAESKHVREITQKLADFTIETDTDLSSMPTDTDNSSLQTESELEGEMTETDRESAESVIDKHELEERRLERLVDVLTAEGLLCAIKIYCDWMSCHPHIIATCAQSSKSLWSRLAVLLNFLPLETDLCKKDLCESSEVVSMLESASTREWSPKQPLSEDLHLQKFPPLSDAHQTLNFDRSTRFSLSSQQETILRVCSLRRFGYQVSRMKSIQFIYDTERAMFLGPLQLEAISEEKISQQKKNMALSPIGQPLKLPSPSTSLADAEARRNQLMRDMAQLRLQAEVSQLEGSLQSADQPSLPPYLVPDAGALCENLTQIKQLSGSARFIIIIPLAVIDQLDLLKKESPGARQAIRWLEEQFRKGNRYVRAQKTHEKLSTVPHKNLKKRDKDAWRVLQMIDCCKYLSQQSTDCDTQGLACIMTNLSVTSPDLSTRVRQAFTTAQQEGLLIQSVPDFYAQWKEIQKMNKS